MIFIMKLWLLEGGNGKGALGRGAKYFQKNIFPEANAQLQVIEDKLPRLMGLTVLHRNSTRVRDSFWITPTVPAKHTPAGRKPGRSHCRSQPLPAE